MQAWAIRTMTRSESWQPIRRFRSSPAEAGVDPKIEGRHLGVLTSIVVADVFYGIFQYDRILDVDGNQDLAGQLQHVSNSVF
jgi:hypothetical protein